MPWPALAAAFAWLVALEKVAPCNGDELTLGYLYIQDGASWVIESFSQFKLGIQDVNADPEILPNTTLKYAVRDSEGDERRALAGALELKAMEGHIGLVGTGYSSAIQHTAGFCSVVGLPIVSPGSTLIDLVDKSRFPYLLRSLASDAVDLKAMVLTVSRLGWRACAALYHSDWQGSYSQVWQPAFEALAFTFLPLVLRTPDTAIGKARVTEVLELVSTSGYRVCMVYTKSNDLAVFADATAAAGLRTASYAWMVWPGGFTDALAGMFGGTLSTILSVFPVIQATGNPVSEAYAARWPLVSTLYNASIHGEFNKTTKEPFFGGSTFEPVVWDTDYAPVGDGLPDFWGKFVYDTVWLYARAIHGLQSRGDDPRDGKALRAELLQQNFLGVSGQIWFDQESQDGSKDLQIVLLQDVTAAPYVLGNVTCRSSCDTFLHTTVGIPWPAGAQPSDGLSLDHDESKFFISSSFPEETAIEVTVHVRDSFRNVPCASACSDGDLGDCDACQVAFVNYSALEPRFVDATGGGALEAAAEMLRNVSYDSGTAALVLPQGLLGGGIEHRTVVLDILYEGRPLAGSGARVQLLSTACDAGYRTGSGRACVPCSPGSFSDTRGSPSCTACAPGTFQEEAGQTACDACEEGHFAASPGMSECARCGKGSFQSEERQSNCIDCKEVLPGSSQTRIEGATEPEQCVCQEGSYYMRPAPGASPVCEACPEGLKCPEGTGSPLQAERYHAGLPAFADGPPTFVVRCSNSDKCPRGMALNTCPPNRVGLACDHCHVDYFENRGGDCKACDTNARFLPTLVLLLAALAFTIVLYTLSVRQLTVTSQNVATLTITASLVLNGVQSLSAFNELSLQWEEPMQSLNLFLRLLTLQLDYVNPGCAFQVNDPVVTYAGSLLIYPAAFLLLLAVFAVGRLRGQVGSWSRMWNAMGVAMMGFYLSLAMASVLPLQCTRNPDGSSSVAAQRSVLCGSKEHMSMMGMSVVAIIVYIVPFFTLVMYFTLMYKRMIARNAVQFVRRTEFLFKRFRTQYYYYGLVFISRNLIVALIPVVFSGQAELQVMAMQSVITVVLCLTCYWCPWRTKAASLYDALISLGLISILVAGTIFTSFNSERTMRIIQWVVMAELIVMFGAAVCLLLYNAMQYFWPRKTYGMFLSHHKGSAQVLARWFKIGIQERSAEAIFLDSDNLEELPALLHVVGFETKNLVVLLTRQMLSRLWCACEVAVAHKHRVNIVLVSCDGTEAPSADYLSDLTGIWTEGDKAELTNLGIELSDIAKAYAALRHLPLLKLTHVKGQGFEESIIKQVMERCAGLGGRYTKILREMATGQCTESHENDERAEVFIAGRLDDPEAFCCCQVVRKMLLRQTHMVTAICGGRESVLKHVGGRDQVLVAMLSRGVLSCPGFAAAVVTARQAGTVSVLPVLADAAFRFPDAEFWLDFSNEQVLDPNDPALSGIELHQVEEAYRAMFKVIAVKFTECASEKIQHAEIAALVGRMKPKIRTTTSGFSLWSERSSHHSGFSLTPSRGRRTNDDLDPEERGMPSKGNGDGAWSDDDNAEIGRDQVEVT